MLSSRLPEIGWSRRDTVALAVLCGFLLLYFFPFIIANSALFQIGNDFQLLYANYATYFVDAARMGFLPLWNPNEAAGYPLLSNPFTAFFYPGKLLWYLLALRSPVYSWYHHQIYMVIGVLILAAGLYLWLRNRHADVPESLFAAGVIAVGYRIADIYRLPNAVHAAAWMPWILLAYDRWLEGRRFSGFLLGNVSLICLATAGYPYYALYASILIGSYVILRIAEGVPVLRAVSAIATMTLPAVLIVLPYFAAISRMLSQTVDRNGGSYSYSAGHSWTYLDLLGGLVFPLSAVSEGWMYVGIFPVLLAVVWFAVGKPKGAPLVWIGTFALLVQLLAAGAGSFLFPAVWTLVPGASSLRVWARTTIVLLPPLALLISMSYAGVAAASFPREQVRRWLWRAAAAVSAVQILLWTTKTYSSYLTYFPYMQGSTFVFATLVGAIYLVVWTSWSYGNRMIWALLALVVTAADTGTYGLQTWRAGVGVPVPHASLHLDTYYANYFDTPRGSGAGMSIPYTPAAGIMPNWYFGRYVDFLAKYQDRPGFLKLMGETGRKIFLSPELDAPPAGLEEWSRQLEAFESAAHANVALTAKYSGNSLQLSYRVDRPAHLIFIDNWDPDWSARLNGQPVELERAFGTFKAVRVPAGSGGVSFEYHPRLPYVWTSAVGGLCLLFPLLMPVFRRRA